MSRHSVLQFYLNISSEEYLTYYQGAVRYVITRATDGRTVRFPASLLRGFVTREGINGWFELSYDANNKFQSIRKIA